MNFMNLYKEYEFFDWKKILDPVFKNTNFINGNIVTQFENEVCKFLRCKYAIGVSSGTDALKIALMAVRKPLPHCRVLTTAYSFVATGEAPLELANIKFCDVGDDFNIDIKQCINLLKNEYVDVFIPVHLFGLPVDIELEIKDICKEKNIIIIEDAAQAFGSKIHNKFAGTVGDIGCFSFFPSKNLNCAGDGGMIVTDNSDIYEKCLQIKNHGCKTKYFSEIRGGNYRLDTIQAAILLEKLKYIDEFITIRRTRSSIYYNKLSKISEIILSERQCMSNDCTCTHTYNQFVIRVLNNKRNELKQYLQKNNIPTQIYYPFTLPEQPVFGIVGGNEKFPMAHKLTQENLALPFYFLEDDEIIEVSNKIKQFFKEN